MHMTARKHILHATGAVLIAGAVTSHWPARAQSSSLLLGTTTQLTQNAASQTDSAISGSLVIWTDQRNGNDDIYYCFVTDCAATERQLTSATNAQRLNDVSGTLIAYTDVNGATRQVIVTDIATSVTSTTSGGADQNPRLDGQTVVFERGPASAVDVHALDVSTGVETAVAATAALELNPAVGGTRVVYERHATGASPGDIVLYDLATNQSAILDDETGDARRPDIDGDIVVWDVHSGTGDVDVVIHDLATGATTRLIHPGNQRSPHISGGVVAFDDDSTGNPNIGLYHIPTATWQLATTSAHSEFLSNISGNRVVFTSNQSGNLDIWMLEFALPVSGDALFTVGTNGGSTVTNDLSLLDPDTGRISFVGSNDPGYTEVAGVFGLAARPSDNKLFAWNVGRMDPTTGESVITGELVTIDSCTGLARRVNPLTPPQGLISGLAFAPDGSLFGGNYNFYRIDPATGVLTFVGSVGAIVKAQAFAADGTLYAVELTRGLDADVEPLPRLFTLNTQTGAATLVATLGADVGRVDSMVFNPATGKFLASGNKAVPGGITIFDLDPATAAVSNVRPLEAAHDPLRFVSTPTGMAFAPACVVGVAPGSIQFGSLELGSMQTQLLTVSNLGAIPLTIHGLTLDPAGSQAFSLGAVAMPASLAVGRSVDIPVSFAPSVAGSASGTVQIVTSAGDVHVALRGTGVATPPPPSEQITAILDFFDESVSDGTLGGVGQGNSAQGRLNALRNMLEAASDLIGQGNIADACELLQDVLDRTDAEPRPPDFVSGAAAIELAARVRALRTALGC
jgi:beta propeller repeat protein